MTFDTREELSATIGMCLFASRECDADDPWWTLGDAGVVFRTIAKRLETLMPIAKAKEKTE